MGVEDLMPFNLVDILHRRHVWGNLKLETPFGFFRATDAQRVGPFTRCAWERIFIAGSRSNQRAAG
jgi:hypothetical protein